MDVCVDVDLLITESMSRCEHPNINRCQTGYIINILLNTSSVKDKVPEILRSFFTKSKTIVFCITAAVSANSHTSYGVLRFFFH
jgi:hypothetical protein